ncbi:MAG: molybdopterin-guanine dinucleotide biosynthesis protein B [Clostridia bacterium]|nr:molybdopterin-guanine dinucleotide biosynthesis protein B [Clostridia bacterium]
MKLISVVGIRKSGKTTTVTQLTEALIRRGLKVATAKTVFCPTFSIDKPTSNTGRHAAAGAEVVVARAKGETAVIYKRRLPLTQVLQPLQGCDVVILEGDYNAPVPRLVAAHQQEDALLRCNDLTLCFVGRIADKPEIDLPLPRFNPLTEADALADFVLAHVDDVQLTDALDIPLPPVAGVTDDGFCQCGCHKNERKCADEQTSVTVDGVKLQLTAEQLATLRQWAAEAKA